MDDDTFIDTTVASLKNAIQEILKKNYYTLSFKELCQNVHEIVLLKNDKNCEKLYTSLKEAIIIHLENEV